MTTMTTLTAEKASQRVARCSALIFTASERQALFTKDENTAPLAYLIDPQIVDVLPGIASDKGEVTKR